MTPSLPRASTGVVGLHHVATISRDVARARDFYADVLGLRDLGAGPAPYVSAHRPDQIRESSARFFGDESGRAGSLIAVLDRPDAPQGAPGIGGTHHFALCVDDREALLRWKRRFLDAGYAVNGILDRHYFQSIYVQDPDGTIVELATRGPGWAMDEPADHIGEVHCIPPADMINTNRDRPRIAAENWRDPVPEIMPDMQIRGMHHVTAIGTSIERTHDFVGDRLAMRRVKRTNNFDDPKSYHWYWGIGDGRPGTLVTYFERSPERERPVQMGAGQVSHYAVGASASALEGLRDALAHAQFPVSRSGEFGPDGARFSAIATRDPDGQPVLIAALSGDTSYGVAPETK
jgi:glyoxalase family protein